MESDKVVIKYLTLFPPLCCIWVLVLFVMDAVVGWRGWRDFTM